MPNTQVRPVRDLRNIKFVNEKLKEAELEASKPNAEWIDSKKVIKKMREKYCGL